VGDEVLDKPGRLVDEGCFVRVAEDTHPYASRGGMKLEHALKEFGRTLTGKTAVDFGASTGGFTDCLLQHGARKVFAVDVGYGQLAWKLQSDPKVVIIDRKNARELKPGEIGEPVDLVVVDVSFISLKLVVPSALAVLKTEGDIIALVKPQFEVGKDAVENKGIIKDPKKHLNVLLGLRGFMEEKKWPIVNLTCSPITGQKGNREFFIHCVYSDRAAPLTNKHIRNSIMVKGPVGESNDPID